MTTRLEVLAAARQRIVLDGKCPHCLGDLVEGPGGTGVYCPWWTDSLRHPTPVGGVVYNPETGEVVGTIV